MRKNALTIILSLMMCVTLILSPAQASNQTPMQSPIPSLLLAQLEPGGSAGTGVDDTGADGIGASTVNYISHPTIVPGSTIDLCFNTTFSSPDGEYLDRFDFDLPDTWVINSVTDVSPTNTCGLGHMYGYTPYNVVYWQTNGFPNTGCGEWSAGTYDFCANVTIPECSDLPLPWYIYGDGVGAEPHMVTGAAYPECLSAGIYLEPTSTSGGSCHGTTAEYSFSLFNNTGSSGDFSLAYSISDPVATLTGPDSIYVADGETVEFDAAVNTTLCSTSGGVVDGLVEASGFSYSASAAITHSIMVDPYWNPIPNSGSPWDPSFPSMDGCTAQNSVGEWVTYQYGVVDGAEEGSLWGYIHETNTWQDTGLTLGSDSVVGAEWAYDDVSNMCYMVTGYDPANGLVADSAFRYDPEMNEVTTLGSITTARYLGESWVATLDGTRYLCIGGGSDTSAAIDSTQCYDLSQAAPGTWEPENAQLDPYPDMILGAADGVLHAPGGDQLWLVGGAQVPSGTILDTAYYWDDADNSWHLAGHTGSPRYASEGEFMDGKYYIAGGIFPPSPLATAQVGSFDGSEWSWEPLPAMSRYRYAHIVTAVEGEIWAWGGITDGSLPDLVEKLQTCIECQAQDISILPTNLVAEQAPDTTTMQEIQICNNGELPLDWMLAETSAITPTLLPEPTATLPAGGSGTFLKWPIEQQTRRSAEPFMPAVTAQPDSLLYYNERSIFDTYFPGLPVEGFENSSIAPGIGAPIPHPLDATSSNAYFDPGDILPGIQFWATGTDVPGQELAVLGEDYLTSSKSLGASYLDYAPRIVFDPPVEAVGLQVYSVMGSNQCQIDIYGAEGLLATTASDCDQTGVFWGVFSDAEPISEIVITDTGSGGEIVDDIAFGAGYHYDITWLSETPLSGMLPGGTCSTVEVSFDSTGLSVGDYLGIISFFNSDPDQPRINVPVTMTISLDPLIVVDPLLLETSLLPDQTGSITFTITNDGFADLTVDISEGIAWLSLDESTGTLAPGESLVITATFDSTGLEPGDYELDFTITSNDPLDPIVNVTARLHILDPYPYDLFLPVIRR